MITLKQFTGQSISPTDDAALYEYFSSAQSGILYGCEVTHLGSNQVQVASGRGMILGRSFLVEQEVILVPLSQSEQQKGRLSIRIDLGNTEKPIEFTTVSGASLEDPVQQELNRGGSVFELPLAEYDVDATQISNLKSVAAKLLPPGTIKTITGTYVGDGESSRTVTLEGNIKWMMLYAVSEMIIVPASSGPINIYAAWGSDKGSSKGLTVDGVTFRAAQHRDTPPDGKKVQLNASGKTYVYVVQIGG